MAFAGTAPREKGGLKRARSRLFEARKALQERGVAGFWLGVEPAVGIDLDLQNPLLEDYLWQPELTGNRRIGWNFTRFLRELRLGQGKLSTHPDESRLVEIRGNGGLTFEAPLAALYWKGEDPRQIWPYILLEYPVSAFRLARKIYERKLGPADLLAADLALIGVRGWKLRPGSPEYWSLEGPAEYRDAPDLVWENPLVFRFEEIASEPDRCGYRLVERVYEAFGFRRAAIPEVFDRAAGRLVLPE